MSTWAAVKHPGRHHRRVRLAQLQSPDLVPVQWTEVPVANSGVFLAPPTRSHRARLWWVVALAVAAHALAIWTLIENRNVEPEKRTAQLAIELVRPPKPEPPKVEPPKPPPPKPRKVDNAPPPILAAAPVETVAEPAAVVAVAPPAPPPAPPAPEPVKAAFGGIGYKNNPAPDYPALAVRQGWQGTVLLRVKVSPEGHAAAVEVVRSSGKKLLDDEAIRTVNTWVFAPSTRGGAPIEGFATVPIEFKLDS
jgi:protein TonB